LEYSVVALCLLVTARTLHGQMPLGACAVQRAPTAWPGRTMQAAEGIVGKHSARRTGRGSSTSTQQTGMGCKLTSGHHQWGLQACAVRRVPCQTCSSWIVGQSRGYSRSEHWTSWPWQWTLVEGRVSSCGFVGGSSDLRGAKGDQLAGESSAGRALGHSMGTRARALERRPSVLPGHVLPGQAGGVIGGCAKSSQTSNASAPPSRSAS
jgi:hypothetical protein